jgi:HSP20 family protein
MEDFWKGLFGEMPLEGPDWGWTPSVDISETDGVIQVKAELAGLEAKDIDVCVTDTVLTLGGEKKIEKKQEGERSICCERCSRSFQRSFRLPGIQSDKVDAEFKNGVLTIKLPKSEESKKRKVKIKAA